MVKLDILIPAKNEAGNLPTLLERISRICKKSAIDYRAIIINDYSTDNTSSVLEKLKTKYPLEIIQKKGKPGKAFAILEGAEKAETEYVLMIDADLQYPPEAIPEMLKLIPEHGVVIAERSKQKTTFIRQLFSKANRYLLGKFVLGIDCDAQSGMKLFRRGILTHLDIKDVDAWAIDMPLLHTALELGLTVSCVNIEFAERQIGNSKVNLFKTTKEILFRALKLKFKTRKVYHLPSESTDTMIGAGVIHKRRQFITHTHLHHDHSAIITLHRWQKIFLISILALLFLGFEFDALDTAIIFVAILSAIYFLDVFFNLFLVLKSLHFPPEINFSSEEINKIDEKKLPIYSILCPLYREARVLPAFVESINNFDYPKDKLDVLLLLEEDDTATIKAAKELKLPKHFRTIIVPHSQPKTKPKACNYGLSLVKGEYVVIYDAEDRPDPDQLKKAYLGFQNSKSNIVCLQAKLNYYNPRHNLLTRLFTAEYSLWFDITLPGLQSISTTIPLGGTSNHFRTPILKDLHGWDSFNVTEDCDLGARLFKLGYQTAIIDSTTLEEANSHLGNWIRQRSRWIKGYIQTYLVHNRHPLKFIRSHSIHAFIFQLVVGGKIAFMLINPILWLMTISYFLLYKFVGPTIESLYPASIFYMAVFSMIFGNFLFLYYYMIGCAKRGHYELIKYVFFVPFYWIAISVAAVKALYQLIVKPHFWEKTHHGLHLKPETKSVRVGIERFSKLKNLTQTKLFNNTSLVISSIIVNFVNFLYNTYLSRSSKVSLADFGTIGLLGSFAFILQIPQTALFSTVSYRSAYLLGKYGSINKTFWQHTRKTIVKISIITTLIWIGTSPFLASVFGSDTYLPFLIFSPLITISFISAIDSGFIQGSNRFVAIAIISILESISKLIITIFLVQQNWINLVYISIPISAGIYLITSWIFALRLSQQDNNSETDNVKYFPKKYFISSLTIKLSTLSFLGLDLILAKAYLTPSQAGLYTLVSLVGKLIFSVSSIFSQFITPIISKAEGAGDNSKNIFYKILVIATISSLLIATTFSLNNSTLSVLLFGKKIVPVIHLIPIFSIGVILFTITNNIVNYHQIKHQYIFSFISLLISSIQILLLSKANNNLELFVSTVVWVNIFNFILVIFLHLLYPRIGQIVNGEHITYLIDKILQNKNNQIITPNLRILIFNWRDTKHVWAGGAEVYVHELAKNWVKFGHQVTIFCGNDYKCSNYEIIDGVKIYRKGGFFTVYLWAAIYYLIKFRGKFDVIVDSENGIPFFTPLYSRIPKFLLIHHVHQNVFREQLPFPLAQIAMFLESKVMPFLYRGQKIITVSNSSRNDIIRLKIGKKENISIVNPGINPTSFHKSPKSRTPNFIYLGRLRPYKNIDIAIKSVAKLIKKYPNLKLNIAGWGENIDELKKLSHKLEIEKSVIFLEKVSEKDKINLLGKSWAMIQPSSFEGWGITVIEANACGTPVIASNVVGLRDSVINKKTGLLVQVKNIDQLSKTIEKLIKNKKIRQELSSQALLWANRFNWEEKSREFLNIITDSLSKEYSFKCDLALVEND